MVHLAHAGADPDRIVSCDWRRKPGAVQHPGRLEQLGQDRRLRSERSDQRRRKAAHDRGIVVAFAAGNAGPANDTLNPYSVAPWVVGVAAGNKDGQTLADFSSRGVPGSSVYQPTITAPGVDIVAARALTGAITVLGAQSDTELGADAVSYTTMSGTSMATPHVAGVVALMLEANPALSPDEVNPSCGAPPRRCRATRSTRLERGTSTRLRR